MLKGGVYYEKITLICNSIIRPNVNRFGQNVQGRGFNFIKIQFFLSISIAIFSWSSLRSTLKYRFLFLWRTVFSVSLLLLIIKVSYKDLVDLTGSFFYYLKQVPAASLVVFCPMVLANLHKFEYKTLKLHNYRDGSFFSKVWSRLQNLFPRCFIVNFANTSSFITIFISNVIHFLHAWSFDCSLWMKNGQKIWREDENIISYLPLLTPHSVPPPLTRSPLPYHHLLSNAPLA